MLAPYGRPLVAAIGLHPVTFSSPTPESQGLRECHLRALIGRCHYDHMAENRLRELRDEVSGESTLLRERVTLAQAGEHFIAHVRFLGRSPNTISSYEGYLRAQLVPYFEDEEHLPVAKITQADVKRFMQKRAGKGAAPKSIANYVGFLRSVLEHARAEGWRTGPNPCDGIERPVDADVNPDDIRYLTLDELEELLSAVEAHHLHGLSVRREIKLVRGLRAEGVSWGDIPASLGLRTTSPPGRTGWPHRTLTHHRMRTRRCGASNVRCIWSPRSPDCAEASCSGCAGARSTSRPGASACARTSCAARSCASRRPSAPAVVAYRWSMRSPGSWTASRRRLRSPISTTWCSVTRLQASRSTPMPSPSGSIGGSRARVTSVTFHELRHTYGTTMAAGGMSLRDLQEYPGRADSKTTQVYAHFQPGKDEVAAANSYLAAARARAHGFYSGSILSETQTSALPGNPMNMGDQTSG